MSFDAMIAAVQANAAALSEIDGAIGDGDPGAASCALLLGAMARSMTELIQP